MKTCEQCGLDTVDARGICRNCGWQQRNNRFSDMDDTPSLGETRAADVPPGGYPVAGQPSQAARSTRMNPYPTEARAPSPAGGAGGATSGGRFCGTCGARLEPGIAFCGQCGTPVAAASPGGPSGGLTFGNTAPRPPSQEQYRIGGWPEDDGNEVTEMIPGPLAQNGFGRSGIAPGSPYSGAAYRPLGYAPGQPASASASPASSSRTTRLVIGVLCLVGSIISASAAIILALTMPH